MDSLISESSFEKKVTKFLYTILQGISLDYKFKIKEKEKIAIALSGGVDSLSLVFALKKLNIVVLHFNHSIRQESDDEELYLKNLMHEYKIPFFSKKWQGEYLKSEHLARQKRYEFLTEKCIELNIKFLLTAHHADDQIETFLINLSRGSSLDGLTAMKEFHLLNTARYKEKSNTKIFLIRPLLSISKQECINFMNEKKIQYCEDKSNKNTKFLRNNIRSLLEQINGYDLTKNRILDCIKNLQNARFFIEKNINKSIKSLLKLEKIHQNNLDILKYKNKASIISIRKFLKLTKYEKYHILNYFINLYEERDCKIRKSFLDILISDIENNYQNKLIIKKNLKKTNIHIDFRKNLIFFILKDFL